MSLSISFEGVQSSTKAHDILRRNAAYGLKEKYEMDFSYMKITGNFVISDYKVNSSHDDFESFFVTMYSAGEIDIEVGNYDL